MLAQERCLSRAGVTPETVEAERHRLRWERLRAQGSTRRGATLLECLHAGGVLRLANPRNPLKLDMPEGEWNSVS